MDENNKPIDPERILNESEDPQQEVPPETAEAEAPESGQAPAPGAPERQELGAADKGRRKLPLRLIGIALAVVVVIVIIAAAVSRSPLSLVVKGAKNSAESLEKNAVVALMNDIAKGGSVELACGLDDITESVFGFSVEGSASLKMYSSDDPGLALVAGLEVDGSSVLDATLVANQNDIALASDVLFGSKAYGISLKNFVKNFENSVFGPDGEYSIGLDPETVEEGLNSVTNGKQISKDAAKVLEGMTEALVKSVKSRAEVKKSAQVLDFGGDEVKTTAVTATLDGPAIIGVAGDMVRYMQTDKDLKAFLEEHTDYLSSYGFYGYDDPEKLPEQFYGMLDEAAEDLKDAAEEAEGADAEITLTFYVTKSGSLLVGAELDADIDGSQVKMSVYAGPSFEELKEVSFRYDDGYTNLRGAYTVKTRDKNEYAATLKIREDGETVLSGQINWDKKDGGLLVEFTDDWGGTYGLEGSMTQSGKTTTLTIGSAYSDYGDIDLGVDIILNSSDKMPSVPKYTDIMTMNTDDIEALVYDLYDTVRGFSSLMYLF